MEFKRCPMCGEQYVGYPATSRTSGAEDICSNCGTKQAISAYLIAIAPSYSTRGISEWAKLDREILEFLKTSLNRHKTLDWGDCCEEDKHTNDMSLSTGERVIGVYNIPESILSRSERPTDDSIWIITEADRSATTILFPSEY